MITFAAKVSAAISASVDRNIITNLPLASTRVYVPSTITSFDANGPTTTKNVVLVIRPEEAAANSGRILKIEAGLNSSFAIDSNNELWVAGYNGDGNLGDGTTSSRSVFTKSKMLSADVDAGFDPVFASASEKNNSAFLGRGVGINKYTGARGKSGASDANAEFVAWVRNLVESNNIKYQISELGKVDLGGGGTIAYILANKGMDVIDCGVPVLSMHAPYEVTSKFDIYEAYRTYKEFYLK